jgi:hypothetical protein
MNCSPNPFQWPIKQGERGIFYLIFDELPFENLCIFVLVSIKLK